MVAYSEVEIEGAIENQLGSMINNAVQLIKATQSCGSMLRRVLSDALTELDDIASGKSSVGSNTHRERKGRQTVESKVHPTQTVKRFNMHSGGARESARAGGNAARAGSGDAPQSARASSGAARAPAGDASKYAPALATPAECAEHTRRSLQWFKCGNISEASKAGGEAPPGARACSKKAEARGGDAPKGARATARLQSGDAPKGSARGCDGRATAA